MTKKEIMQRFHSRMLLTGWPCDMDSIMSLAREYDLKVIEDCAWAHGALYKENRLAPSAMRPLFRFARIKSSPLAAKAAWW